jgi:hypothetical protein
MTSLNPTNSETETAASKFTRFHNNNPEVYETLVRLAREWVRRTGRHKLGIASLFERTRWEIAIATSDADFKLNNNYRSWYARLIMHQEKDLIGIFDLRKSEADSWIWMKEVYDG